MFDAQHLVERILSTVASHALPEGGYSRYRIPGKDRETGPNPYGTADAVNILYILRALPKGQEARALADTLLAMQDMDTGLFREKTHHPIHTTAHVTAALELLGERPRYPLTALAPYFTIPGMTALLEEVSHDKDPWSAAHRGAGIYAAGILTDSVTQEWRDAYFDWIFSHTDTAYAINFKNAFDPLELTVHHYYPYLYGHFHYLFNFAYEHRAFPYPEKILNMVLFQLRWSILGEGFGKSCSFREMDVVYTIARSMRQTGHRFAEARDGLQQFADSYLPALEALPEDDLGWDDLHMLFGALCAVAELQSVLPGQVFTDKPLRSILDERPFI